MNTFKWPEAGLNRIENILFLLNIHKSISQTIPYEASWRTETNLARQCTCLPRGKVTYIFNQFHQKAGPCSLTANMNNVSYMYLLSFDFAERLISLIRSLDRPQIKRTPCTWSMFSIRLLNENEHSDGYHRFDIQVLRKKKTRFRQFWKNR